MATTLKQLQTLLEFSDEDLTANRKGRLSVNQVDFLRRKAMHELNAVMIVPFGIAVIALSALSLEMALPVVIVIGIIMAALYSFHRQHLEEIAYKQVETVQGRLTKLPKSSSVTHHAISLNGEKFAVDRDFYYQIVEGDYTFYLMPDTRQIFGIEPGKKGTTTTTTTAARKTTPTKAVTTKATTATKPKSTATKTPAKTASTASKTTTKATSPATRATTPTAKSTTATASTRKPAATSPKSSASSKINEFGFSEKPAKPKGVVAPKGKTTTASRSTAPKPASTSTSRSR